MTNTQYTNGSHVNFTCNPFYELVGRNRLFCYGSEWEKDVPECRLMRDICLIRPNFTVGFAYMKQITKVEIKHELDYFRNQTVLIYTMADFTCMPGYQFANDTSSMVKMYDTKVLSVQNISCTGYNRWMDAPVCVPIVQAAKLPV